MADMQDRMAKVLGVNRNLVNVKVKSGEGLDAIGREEAIAAQAVCLIEHVKTS
ncbi:MAG: 2-C-methyl-D-erythritol 2,4-cyclodiphosphate synthase [Terriglobia bacterium]